VDRIRDLTPHRLLLAGGTATLAAIAIATVVMASRGSSSEHLAFDDHAAKTEQGRRIHPSRSTPMTSGRQSSAAGVAPPGSTRLHEQAIPSRGGSEPQSATLSELTGENASANLVPFSSTTHRDVERSAQVSLLAESADIADDSAAVFAAVHDARGIVLHSTTTSGKRAGAQFDLLIPSARLGDALAAISSIDEVSSRHEATGDITAPIVSAREELADSRARIDTLLTQLAAAETETEAEAVESELRGERRHAARLRAQLANLDWRTTYSRVSVRIASDPSADSGGAWGFDDAIGEAGHILAIAAAVTLVGLAIAAPIALIALLAWFAHRLWLRTRRERALDA
jgi:hypothetical protein